MASGSGGKDRLLNYLKEHGIESETVEHGPVMTVEETLAALGHLEGGLCKNLLLRDKKNRLYLVSALASTKVDLKVLSQRLGLGKSGLRFASDDLMQAVLQVPLGSVTPFALISPAAGPVSLLLDHHFRSQPRLLFHPLTNTATTAVTISGFEIFVRSLGREQAFVDLEASPVISKDLPPDLAGYVPSEVSPLIREAGGNGLVEEGAGKAETGSAKDAASGVKAAAAAVSSKVPTAAGGGSSGQKNNGAATKPSKGSSNAKAAAQPAAGSRPDDVPAVVQRVLDTIHQLQRGAGAGEGVQDRVGGISDKALKEKLVPELESVLVLFKNTAYTSGFTAGLAAGAVQQPCR